MTTSALQSSISNSRHTILLVDDDEQVLKESLDGAERIIKIVQDFK